MAKTKAEVVKRALRMMNKLALGQTPSGELNSDMEDAYDEVYAKLARLDIANWSSTGSVPTEYVEDVAALVAAERSHNLPNDLYQKIIIRASRSIINISAMNQGKSTSHREYRDY